MADFKTFEDLAVYQLARKFRKDIYALTRRLPKSEQFNLASQMKRASVSLTNNIAEGHGRYHYQENIQFLRHSRGSLQELIDDLNVCQDEDYFAPEYLGGLRQDAFELLKKLNGYISYLRKSKASVASNESV